MSSPTKEALSNPDVNHFLNLHMAHADECIIAIGLAVTVAPFSNYSIPIFKNNHNPETYYIAA